MTQYQLFESPKKWFSMVYPVSWEMMVVEEIPAFFDPHGNGALQVYSFENTENNYDLDEEMERYLAVHEMSGQEIQTITLTNEDGYDIRACEFKKEDRFWILFMLGRGKGKMVLATYNCDAIIDEATAEIIFSSISSIKIRD